MGVRGVVFDIGGVLEYTPELHVLDRWEERLGLAAGEINLRLGSTWSDGCYGRISEADVFNRIMEVLPVDRATAEAFQADLWVEYLGTPNQELLDYFRALGDRCPTAILSNSFVGARERETSHIGLEGLCSHVVYSHEVGFYKPEPEIYLLTCQRLGLPPERVAFLDDNPDYLRGAEDVGIHAIPFTENSLAIQAIEGWLTAGGGELPSGDPPGPRPR